MTQNQDPAVHEISVDEFDEFIENHETLVILDVREPAEHAAAHIPRSVNVPLDLLAAAATAGTRTTNPALAGAREKTIVIYCADGSTSRKAVALLQARGFERVYCLAGGLAHWRAAGQAVIAEDA
jgi:rhodanese-related sulfurtransferase